MLTVTDLPIAWHRAGALDARALLQRAQGMWQKWPETFRGFEAVLRCSDGSAEVWGEVRVLPSAVAEVDLGDDELRARVAASLREVSDARTPRFFKDGDGGFPVALEAATGEPRGWQVRVDLGAGAWRRYWIDEKGRIVRQECLVVARRTLRTYDGFVRTTPGRVLPTRLSRLVRDVASGTVVESVEAEEAHGRVEDVWLPRAEYLRFRRASTEGQLRVELERHRLL